MKSSVSTVIYDLFKLRLYILLLVVVNFSSSCTKKDIEVEIPSYISIEEIGLTTGGANDQNITDAWVFINDDLVGIYELPTKFPVLKEGSFRLAVFAGIKENGISSTRKRYIFYSGYEKQINLIKNETIEINPQVAYLPEAKLAWTEDFENAGLSFTYSIGSDTVINKTNITAAEGTSAGHIFLTPNMDFFEAQSPMLNNSIKGNTVFLELNFKTNEPVLVGLYADNDQVGIVNLGITSTWKKIYINFTHAINSRLNANNFRVFFGIRSTPLQPFISPNPEIFIDNIKLVHF